MSRLSRVLRRALLRKWIVISRVNYLWNMLIMVWSAQGTDLTTAYMYHSSKYSFMGSHDFVQNIRQSAPKRKQVVLLSPEAHWSPVVSRHLLSLKIDFLH